VDHRVLSSPILILLILSTCTLYNCDKRRENLNEIYAKISDLDPEVWRVEHHENSLVIILKDSVWTYNPINMPPFFDDDEFIDYVKGYGFKIRYELNLEYVEKWSEGKLVDIERKNEVIRKEIAALPKKYSIDHLSHKFDSYIGGTDEERERVKKYEEEREQLEKKLETTPDFHTMSYSIFLSDNRPFWFYQIWPAEASTEVYQLEEKIRKRFKTPGSEKESLLESDFVPGKK
jgi:hypothetical protein